MAAVLAYVFWRVGHRPSSAAVDRDEVNVAIASDNREMLTSAVMAEEAEESSVEVDLALLEDVKGESDNPPLKPTSRWPLFLVAALIPLIAFGLYWELWGRPGTVMLQDAADVLATEVNETTTRIVVDRLQGYVAVHPDDERAWVSLMSFQWLVRDREGFRTSHKAAELEGHVSPFGDSLYLLEAFRQRQLDLTPYDRLVRERLRDVDNSSQVVAMFDAIEYTAGGNFLAANRAWEDVLGQPDLFELHGMADLGQRATRTRLEPPIHPKIRVNVSLAETFPNMRWLFVYARASDNQPPLAVVKRPLNGRKRFDVVLDDSVSMQPNALLSQVGDVVVTARLSPSPDALAQSEDLHETSERVDTTSQPQVELAFGSDEVLVSAKLTSDRQISPVEAVFIIVKNRVVSGPPLAVRRVFGPISQDAIEVTLADMMMPGTDMSDLGELEVFARFSASSMASTNPGDIESASVPFELGSTVELTLDQPVGVTPRN